ncbi:MAG: alpha/beta fold hydrolase [Lysobacterales bacterium]
MKNLTVNTCALMLAGLLAYTAGPVIAQSGTPSDLLMPSCDQPSAGNLSYDQLIDKYGEPTSRFVVLEGINGIRLHYTDEGSGPAVVLVHSSFGDLRDWDHWVEVLSKNYRVIRLELPAFGLTGPVPSGNYSVDRYLTLVDALMDHLNISRFAIVGASYGGLIAARYSSTRIDRVSALILANSAGIEYGGRRGTKELPIDPNARFKPALRTNEITRTILNTVINDPSKVTDEIVQRKTDYANMQGRDCESFIASGFYERGNPQRILGHVRAPALVMWGGNSKALSPETAQAFIDGLKNAASTKKIIYDGGGHLIHIERPEQTVRDAKTFLDQQLGSNP